MAQKREKEETELKVPKKNLPICGPPQSIPAPSTPILAATRPLSEIPDPKSSTTFTFGASSSKETDHRGVSKRPRNVTRCPGSGCRKRIGLMGFRCRCGNVFCSEHRYSDRHDCSYDYKAAGRDAIERENPVVRASKLLKVKSPRRLNPLIGACPTVQGRLGKSGVCGSWQHTEGEDNRN